MIRVQARYFPPSIAVEDIYQYTPVIREGWEETGDFRPPKIDEFYIAFGTDRTGNDILRCGDANFNLPRIIVRQKPKRKVITFTFVRKGQPKDSEYYKWSHSDFMYQWGVGPCNAPQMSEVEIYERVESEI